MAQELNLPEGTLENLNQASEVLDELEKFVQKASLAGHDVSNVKKMMLEKRTQIRKHKEAFFPNG